jgi:hypothetical protein
VFGPACLYQTGAELPPPLRPAFRCRFCCCRPAAARRRGATHSVTRLSSFPRVQELPNACARMRVRISLPVPCATWIVDVKPGTSGI